MTLGERLIAEIVRRENCRRMFDDDGYETLRTVNSVEALRIFLVERGYGCLSICDDPALMAQRLYKVMPDPIGLPLVTLGVGTAIALAAFNFAMAAVPATVSGYREFDLLVLQNMGTIYPLFLGFWSGFVQQSLRAILLGMAGGALIGGLYRIFSGGCPLLGVLLGPFLIVGLGAVLLGRTWKRKSQSPAKRFAKGALAAWILVFAIGIAEWVLNHSVMRRYPSLPQYRLAVWILGTMVAVSYGGYFLILFHWAAGLVHPHWGRRLRSFVSYRETAGLERISGDPQRVWEEIDRQLQARSTWHDAWRLRQFLIGLSPVLPFLAVTVATVLSDQFRLPSYLYPVLSLGMQMSVAAMGVALVSSISRAVRQSRRNARVAAELLRYPLGTTLEELRGE